MPNDSFACAPPAVTLLRTVCDEACARSFVDDSRVALAQHGVIAAVQKRSTSVIFDWLLSTLSYQGISDSVAAAYMESHGRVRWNDVVTALGTTPNCPKLRYYWSFSECHNRKVEATCANPSLRPTCPLPRHDLRNGRLNQTAYSLFFFIRDIARGDIVGWIDQQLDAVAATPVFDRPARLRHALLWPLGHVHGVSNKVLSDLLLAGDAKRQIWVEAGAVMIAVDTLVHNFLHRSGILRLLGADHAYGPGCYRPDGCAAIIERIAAKIDARRFNSAFPANFPRFVQHAIWRYCAENGLGRCNGNRIDDRAPCEQTDCPVFEKCARVPLNPA